MSPESMPLLAGVRLGSAALQALAEDAGVDALHIKGPSALSFERDDAPDGWPAEIPTARRSSVDVDLLVRPSHVDRLFRAMAGHRWEMAYRFEDGSAFEHASTWLRPGLSAADIHRRFPGISIAGEAAFERLWRDRRSLSIAGYPCTVPAPAAQRLILILHATRGADLAGDDIRRAWWDASEEQRAEVDALAAELGATVALAAGTGRLDLHRGDRQHALWRALSTGDHARTTLWVARVRAEPTWPRRLRTALVLAGPKPGRLRHTLGREPRPGEVAAAWAREWRNVAQEAGRAVRRRLPGPTSRTPR